MTTPLKNTAWRQGLYAVSTEKKCCLGAMRITEDGRTFRYGKAGGTLVPGGAVFGAAAVANHVSEVQTAYSNAAGALVVTVLIGGTALTANQYDDGYLIVQRTATGTQGLIYPIASHTTSAAGTETVLVTLKEPLLKATLATDYFSLIANPWASLVAATDIATSYAGQAFVTMASGEYGWFQTGGLGVATGGDTSAVGMALSPSDTESCLETASGYTGPFLGYVYGTAFESGYCSPVMLTVD